MIRLFCDKDGFENILLEEDSNSLLFNVANHHSEICLNMSQRDFDDEIINQDFIFHFIQNKGRDSLNIYKTPFDNIKINESHLLDDLNAIYVLDVSKEEARQSSINFGMNVLCSSEPDVSNLEFNYSRDLEKNQICEEEELIGWHELLKIGLPPMNSLILSDNYLFANEDGLRGESNIKQLLKAILPHSLLIDFHLLIIAKENDNLTQSECEQLCGRIKSFIENLKLPYLVQFELVLADTIHKRIALSNTFTFSADKGFAIFNSKDSKTVLDDNDILINGFFVRHKPEQGDTELVKFKKSLKKIKEFCDSTKEYNKNSSGHKNKRIFGDCNKDKSLNNRLLMDFI